MSKFCVDKIMSALLDSPTAKAMSKKDAALWKADVERIVQSMSDAKQEAFLSGVGDPKSQYNKKATELLNDLRYERKVAQIKWRQNVMKLRDKDATINKFKGVGLTADEGMSATLVGSNKRIKGVATKHSADSSYRAKHEMLLAGFATMLDSSDTLKAVKDKIIHDSDEAFSIRQRRELHELNRGKEGRPGVTGDKLALELATVYHKTEKLAMTTMNKAGAFMRELKGYSGANIHDVGKIEGNFDKWKKEILQYLDHDRTFGSGLVKENPDDFLEAAYKSMVEGKSTSPNINDGSLKVIAITNVPMNIAGKAERSRSLHFSSPENEFRYLKDWGVTKSLFQEHLSLINRVARDAANMEVFGTNPEAGMLYVARKHGIDLNGKHRYIKNQMDEVLGKTSRPGQSTLANVSSWARAWQVVSKLGGMVLNSAPDVVVKANNMTHNGVKFSEALFESTFGYLRDLNMPQERKLKIARSQAIGASVFINEMMKRSGVASESPRAEKMLGLFYKLNFANFWAESNKISHAAWISSTLGMEKDTAFAGLHPKLSENMGRYGISESHWDLIRSAIEEGADGHFHVGFQNVFDLPEDKIIPIASRHKIINGDMSLNQAKMAIDRFRHESGSKLSLFFSDQLGAGMNDPTARERAMWIRGTSADDPLGIGLRFMAQFKMYPTSMITRTLEDVAFANGAVNWKEALYSDNSNKMGLFKLMTSLTVAGYIVNAATDVYSGREPRVSGVEVMRDAMIRGGAFGLMGDALLSEFDSRHGRNFIEMFAGPVAGQINDIADLKSAITDGEENVGAEFMRLAMNNLPGQNLFYLRNAYINNYLYEMIEYMNPGYRARMERRWRKEYGGGN